MSTVSQVTKNVATSIFEKVPTGSLNFNGQSSVNMYDTCLNVTGTAGVLERLFVYSTGAAQNVGVQITVDGVLIVSDTFVTGSPSLCVNIQSLIVGKFDEDTERVTNKNYAALLHAKHYFEKIVFKESLEIKIARQTGTGTVYINGGGFTHD